MKNKKMKQLSDFEHTLLWMAARYAMNRMSISCLVLPDEIVRNWGDRLEERQRRLMFNDILDSIGNEARFSGNQKNEDDPWIKFASWLDETNRYEVVLENEDKETVKECFLFAGRYYPTNGTQWWVAPDFIKAVNHTQHGKKRWAHDVQHPQLDYIKERAPWLFYEQEKT